MASLKSICIAAAASLALTGAASAMPIGQPGFDARPGAGLQQAAWQCFQFGNCIWRPDAYFQPYAYYGYRYDEPRPRPYRKRTYRR